MIDWLREKFASAISAFYYIWVGCSVLSGGIYGYIIGKMLSDWRFSWAGTGCFFGLVLGLIFGIISGILIYGFSATVIHFSEINDRILSKIYESSTRVSKNSDDIPDSFSSKQEENTKTASIVSNDSSSSELNKKNDADKPLGNNTQSNVWVCTKCGATNPVGSMLCQYCGH